MKVSKVLVRALLSTTIITAPQAFADGAGESDNDEDSLEDKLDENNDSSQTNEDTIYDHDLNYKGYDRVLVGKTSSGQSCFLGISKDDDGDGIFKLKPSFRLGESAAGTQYASYEKSNGLYKGIGKNGRIEISTYGSVDNPLEISEYTVLWSNQGETERASCFNMSLLEISNPEAVCVVRDAAKDTGNDIEEGDLDEKPKEEEQDQSQSEEEQDQSQSDDVVVDDTVNCG